MSRLQNVRVKLDEAQQFTQTHHRHSEPLKRHMFTIGAVVQKSIWTDMQGIVTIDRASSAWSKYDFVVEIRRLVTKPNCHPNTASFLLGKAKQACFAMGYELVVTYTKAHESGASLKAAGFTADKWTGTTYTDGTVDTLIRWGCIRDRVQTEEHRQQTDRLLRGSREFLDTETGWLEDIEGGATIHA